MTKPAAGGETIANIFSTVGNDARANQYIEWINKWSSHYGIPAQLMYNLGRIESDWNPTKRGPYTEEGGIAKGMFQFTDATTRDMRAVFGQSWNPDNPQDAIRGAAFRLWQGGTKNNQYVFDPMRAAATYMAGPSLTNPEKWRDMGAVDWGTVGKHTADHAYWLGEGVYTRPADLIGKVNPNQPAGPMNQWAEQFFLKESPGDWGKAFDVDPQEGAIAQFQGWMPLNLNINNRTGIWEKAGVQENWQPIYNTPGNVELNPYEPGVVSNALGGWLAQQGLMPYDIGYNPDTDAWYNPTTIPNWTPHWNQLGPVGVEQRNQTINELLQQAGQLGTQYNQNWAQQNWAIPGALSQAQGAALALHGGLPYNMRFNENTGVWEHSDVWNPMYLSQPDVSAWSQSPNAATNWGPNQQYNDPFIYQQFFGGLSPYEQPTGLERLPSGLTLEEALVPGPTLRDIWQNPAQWDTSLPGAGGPPSGTSHTSLGALTLPQIQEASGRPDFSPDIETVQNWSQLDWASPGQVSYPMGLTLQSFGTMPLDVNWNPSTSAWDTPAVQNWTPSYNMAPMPFNQFQANQQANWSPAAGGGAGHADWATYSPFSGWSDKPYQSGPSSVPGGYGGYQAPPPPTLWYANSGLGPGGLPIAPGVNSTPIYGQTIGPGGLPLAPGSSSGIYG